MEGLWRMVENLESIKGKYDMEPFGDGPGKLHQAYEFVEKMPIQPNSVV